MTETGRVKGAVYIGNWRYSRHERCTDTRRSTIGQDHDEDSSHEGLDRIQPRSLEPGSSGWTCSLLGQHQCFLSEYHRADPEFLIRAQPHLLYLDRHHSQTMYSYHYPPSSLIFYTDTLSFAASLRSGCNIYLFTLEAHFDSRTFAPNDRHTTARESETKRWRP